MSRTLGLCVDLASGPPGSETGTRPIMVQRAAFCSECGRVHDIEKCPVCGSHIGLGYGLGFGGGIGEYKFCEGDGCDWSWKKQDADEDEDRPDPAVPVGGGEK